MLNTEPEIHVSADVEADGPIPGPHSMLSFASAAYLADKTLPGAKADPRTAKWCDRHPEAWAAFRTDPQDPAGALFCTMLRVLNK